MALLLPLAAEALGGAAAGAGAPAARGVFGCLAGACGRAERRPAAVLGSTLDLALRAVVWASAEERALAGGAGEEQEEGREGGEGDLEAREEVEALQEELVAFAVKGATLLAEIGTEKGDVAIRDRLRRICFRALYRFTGRSPLTCPEHARTEWALALVRALRVLGVGEVTELVPALERPARAVTGEGSTSGEETDEVDDSGLWEERVGAALALHVSLLYPEGARLPMPEGADHKLDLACCHALVLLTPPPAPQAPWHEWYGALNVQKAVAVARVGAELTAAGGVEVSGRGHERQSLELCQALAAVACQHPYLEVRSDAVKALRTVLSALGPGTCLNVLREIYATYSTMAALRGLLVTYAKDRLARAWGGQGSGFAAECPRVGASANTFLSQAAVAFILAPIQDMGADITAELLQEELDAVIPALNALLFLVLRTQRASEADRAALLPLLGLARSRAPSLSAAAAAASAAIDARPVPPPPPLAFALGTVPVILARLADFPP